MSARGFRTTFNLGFVALLAGLLSCGGGRQSSVAPVARGLGVPPSTAPVETMLGQALAELEALPVPEGVDEAVFTQLKEALREALVHGVGARHAVPLRGKETTKITSRPPTGEANRVDDLAITDNGDGTFTLTWSYRNVGDYNQDGIVDIKDVTPLAAHFNEPADETNEWIDGNRDGAITIMDVTPLVANFFSEVEAYVVQSSRTEEGEFTEVDSVLLSSASGEQRKLFSVVISPEPGNWLRVLPVDGPDAKGVPSDLAHVPEWHTATLAQINDVHDPQVSSSFSLASINGNPAIAYNDGIHRELRYLRATDPTGNSWGTPVTVDRSAHDFSSICLTIVQGQPAINYCARTFERDTTHVEVRYVRASSLDGNAWLGPTSLYRRDSSSTGRVETSISIVDGRPAVYYTASYDLRCRYALDSEGKAWGTPVTLVDTTVLCPSPAVVNGKPAVAYSDLGYFELRYIRADVPTGRSWGSPMRVVGREVLGLLPSLAIVDGIPAMSYYDYSNADLKFARASDANGERWEPPITLDGDGDTGHGNSLAIVNGIPAISYCDYSSGCLEYVRATDASGERWCDPVTADANCPESSSFGARTSLALVNGHPAIGYLDMINLRIRFAIYY